ncbi:large ribosomal subunit protein uL18m-like [Lycorma delicatula]|uniref:large ribosomal subunit protein uL18m-like n=1 Tax=Lycorma delicatula TaxID=130591 RepID=UPI003F516E08
MYRPLPLLSFYNNLLEKCNKVSSVKEKSLISFISNSNISVNVYVRNRNPRNLESLRIARKPTGFHLDKPGKAFWHKVIIVKKPRYISARVCHNNGNTVIQASTNEWSISRHLNRSNDRNAYVNLAQILAERSLESGICFMINGIDLNSEKSDAFIKHFEEAGIVLCEPSTYTPLTPWNIKAIEKPWNVHLN